MSFGRAVEVIPSMFSGNILTIRKRRRNNLVFRIFDILCQVLGMDALTRREVSTVTVTDKRKGHFQSIQVVGSSFEVPSPPGIGNSRGMAYPESWILPLFSYEYSHHAKGEQVTALCCPLTQWIEREKKFEAE